ncbi:MAG: hypothetical protein CO093_11295 [Alphaproteobacteria bacterium CG_4_9_14_3_um_filter_47_13]|nr:MAG: hypothetical protein CO093_11295 [Alphaproteobacteria bacterium CG_4_9_14_3_um_filter_47_13]
MTLYYCINDVFDKIEPLKENEHRFQTLVSVSTTMPECCIAPEDVFMLSSSPKMLDLTTTENAWQLAHLIEDIPLYNINMELVLDEALAERHKNSKIAYALEQAFENRPLPNTLKIADKDGDEIFSGDLRHPMLEHLDKLELCRIYIAFLKFLDRDDSHYSFEKNILGKHISSFLDRFDGYITPYNGKIKALILIAFGMRCDHDPGKPMEIYVQGGKKSAQNMNITEPQELIWAWLESDHYQLRRCRDLDRVMRSRGLPKIPNWVKTDVFSCLEKEAMKQVFAESLAQKTHDFALLKNTKHLLRAMQTNAQGHVDETLQQLLSQILSQGTGYAGAAAKFAENAEKRAAEAKKINLA